MPLLKYVTGPVFKGYRICHEKLSEKFYLKKRKNKYYLEYFQRGNRIIH